LRKFGLKTVDKQNRRRQRGRRFSCQQACIPQQNREDLKMTAVNKEKYIFSVLFTTPAFLLFTVFMITPICLSFYYSLSNWRGYGTIVIKGLDNFIDLFHSRDYFTAVKNTLFLVFLSVFIKVPAAAGMAYLLYRTTKGFRIYRVILFLPVVISPIAIGLMFSIILNADIGPLGNFFRSVGLHQFDVIWLSNPKYVLWAVCLPQIWQNMGLHIVIFLAGMQTVSEDVLESAVIDGASSFRVFRKIMLPLIAEISQVSIILTVTAALKSFGYAWTMTGGGPGHASTFFAILMYTKAFEEGRFGYASAVSITVLVYALLFTVVFKWIYGKIVQPD
jgi:raffinose/stachyose/melibiose transport system permease protein